MKKTIEQIDEAIARWQTKLKRAVNTIDKLEQQRKRLVKKTASDTIKAIIKPKPVETLKEAMTTVKPKPLAEIVSPTENVGSTTWKKPTTTVGEIDKIDTGIPDFLQRKAPDPVAEQIREEQAETKKRKARGRIATMKAKQSGETKKMPLSGRAALAALR